MSEVNLAALAESGQDRIDAKAPTPMQEINTALKACGFGRFHIRLLSTALVGIVAGILVSNTTAYLLPSAECDLNMSLLQKGFLNAIPYLGMIFSSVVAGFLTDTFGRKIFLILGNAGIFLFTLMAGSSQTYEVLVTAKFFEGVLFATSFSPTVTLTSEFCHSDIRDRVMLFQSSFAAFGQILIAAMSWGILTHDWKYIFFGGYIVLNTWNFYLYAMSLWSLTACILYSLLPESPKYLLTQQKYDEAREVLIKVYRENTGKPADTYPYAHLWKNKVQQVIDETPEHKIDSSFSQQVLVGLHNVKSMFKKPLGMHLALICSMTFISMVLYNVFRLWFPQLSTVVEYYSHDNGDGAQDLCVMLDSYTNDLKMRSWNTSGPEICVPTKSGTETYINSIILGCVCLIPYLVSGVLVNKVGKKCLLFGAALLSVGGTLGLRWTSSKAAVVALFSLDTSLTQTMISLYQALIIEHFPTTTRTLAISMIMVSGRIGTLVGNVTFPILLNMGCVILFFTLAGMMICVTIMSLFLPSKKK